MRHPSILVALKALVIFATGCGQNSDLDIQDVVLAPDLEAAEWDFQPALASGTNSDLQIRIRNKGAVDARRFRNKAQLQTISRRQH